MKRHVAKDLNNRLKASSKQNSPTPTFQSRLQEIMEFDLLPHKEAIREYISKLQRNTEQEYLLEEDIKSPIEESISKVNALSNLVQNLAVSYPNEFNQFSNFCKSFHQAVLNTDHPQQIRLLTETTSTFKIDPVRLEKWLTDLSPRTESRDQSRDQDQDHINSNDTIPDIAVPVPKDIKQITLPELISHKTEPATKPLEQLLSEIIVSNKVGVAELQTKYHQVAEYYKKWQDKEIQDIYNWARDKKSKLADQDICEAIAIMDRANQLITGGHRLRDTQVLATLVFVSNEEDRGKLCQIQTGEGKTTIASLVAVLKCLQGEKVDIITSNNILAAEGVSAKEDFYSLFGLTVAANNPINPAATNPKVDLPACYKADIVYGSIGNFQFDYLKDSFLGYGTRSGREFSSVILDEVDSMLVDNGRHIAKLANPFPGMDSLRHVYVKIWQELHKAEQELANELSAPVTTETIKARIKDSNPINKALIPEHLEAYAAQQLDKWIDNALYAKYDCHENKQYIIKSKGDEGEKTVTPVDYLNTGVNLNNTVWPHGLHQFLQLKHNLRLTTETLTSAHISNMHYIKKYGNKLFGMSGTLGSNVEKSLLSGIYNVEHNEIPSYKTKRFTELPGLVVQDSNWLDNVVLEILEQTSCNRSVLIICNIIQDVRIIKQSLELFNSLDSSSIKAIKTYIDEDDAEITKVKVDLREVIIATNIAGRGTDLETTEGLKAHGGLHVCISFLPSNQRVEDQAFGRTARQGDPGSGRLIIRESEVDNLLAFDGSDSRVSLEGLKIEEVKVARDLIEASRVEHILKTVIELDLQDELFQCFSSLCQQLQASNRTEGFKFVLEDLKEYWAFWLEQQELKTYNHVEHDLSIKALAQQKFTEFTDKAKILIEGKRIGEDGVETDCSITERIIHNPYYSIKQSEYFLQKNDLRNNKLSMAKDALKQATYLSRDVSDMLSGFYAKLFEVEMENNWYLMERFNKVFTSITQGRYVIPEPDSLMINIDYKDAAFTALIKASNSLAKEINYLQGFFRSNSDYASILLAESSKDSNQDILRQSSLKASIIYGSTVANYREPSTAGNIYEIYNQVELQELLIRHQPTINNSSIRIHYHTDNHANVNNQKSDMDNIITIDLTTDNDYITISYDDPSGNRMPYDIRWPLTKYCFNQQQQTDYFSKGLLPDMEYTIIPTEKAVTHAGTTSNDSLVYQQELLQNNLLLKHLCSRLVYLKVQQSNVDKLLQFLSNSNSSNSEEVIISSKSSNYFKETDPSKEIITDSEITELQSIGLVNIYGLSSLQKTSEKTSEEIPEQEVKSISNGLTLLKTGEDLPFLLPLMKQVAYILIAEEISVLICDMIGYNDPSSDNQLHLRLFKNKVIIKTGSLMDEQPSSFIEEILQYTVRTYQESIIPEGLPSITDLYEEIFTYEPTMISQDFEQVDEENYYDLLTSREENILNMEDQAQDITLAGCNGMDSVIDY